MFSFSKREKALLIVAAMLLVLLLLATSATKAHAQFEANRVALAMAGAQVDTFEIEATSARELPKGYTFWSGDGAEFWITPFASATALESVPIKVPANTPITVSAPKMFKVGDTYYHWILCNATSVTDSVFTLPLDK